MRGELSWRCERTIDKWDNSKCCAPSWRSLRVWFQSYPVSLIEAELFLHNESLSFFISTYRNYVVQHLLGLRMQEVTKYLLQRFQGRFLHLSCNKYASNVVEKMLESGEECCTTILLELLSNPNASMLLLDPFGNFVIQSALSSSKVRYPTSLQLGNSNINNSNLCFVVVECFRLQ